MADASGTEAVIQGVTAPITCTCYLLAPFVGCEALDPLQEARALVRLLGRAVLDAAAGVPEQRHAGEHFERAAREPEQPDEHPARRMTHVERRIHVTPDDAHHEAAAKIKTRGPKHVSSRAEQALRVPLQGSSPCVIQQRDWDEAHACADSARTLVEEFDRGAARRRGGARLVLQLG